MRSLKRAMTVLAVEGGISEDCRALQLGDSVGAAERARYQTLPRSGVRVVVSISEVDLPPNFAY